MTGQPQDRDARAIADALEAIAAKVHNGAPDPFQEFYDLGVGHWLQREVSAIRYGYDLDEIDAARDAIERAKDESREITETLRRSEQVRRDNLPRLGGSDD